MIRRARPGARRVALLAVVVGVAAGIALGVVSCVGGVDDADRYGRVSLPGRGTLELPEGEVHLYYEERTTLSENESLDIPEGLVVVARREETIRSQRILENEISLDGRALREFAKLEIPRAGTYRVAARSRGPGFNRPAVTFGEGQLSNLGSAALAAGMPMAAGAAVALLALLLGRRGYTPPTPYELAQQRPPLRPPPPPAAPPPAPPPVSGDPLEAQLRELDRRHAAGQMSDDEHRHQRQAAIDAAFGPPG